MADGEIILGVDIDKSKAEEKLNALAEELSKLELDKAINTRNLRKFSLEVEEYTRQIQEVKRLARQANVSIDNTPSLKADIEAIEAKNRAAQAAYDSAFKSQFEVKNRIKEINAEIKNIQTKPIRDLEEANKRASTAAKELAESGGKISKSFNKLSEIAKNTLGGISYAFRRIMYLASSAFVFNVISAGFRALSRELRNLIGQDAEFVMWLNNIKANLLTAFYPIYQVCIPILRSLGKMLAWVTGQLANFVAMLTGTSVSANQRGAKQLAIQSKTSLENRKGIRNTSPKYTKIKLPVDDLGESTSKAYKNIGKAADSSADKLIKFDKIIKSNRAELAKFDKIEVLKRDKLKSNGDTTKKLKNKIKNLELKVPIIPEPVVVEGFDTNLSESISPFVENIKNVIDRLKKPLESISFENVNIELGKLWDAVSRFSGTIGEGLFWFYENVLVPLSKWTIEEVLPRFLNILSNFINAIDPIVKEVGEQLGMLYNVFLKPVAEWVGDKITKFLSKLADWIKDIGDAIKDNQLLLEFLSAFLIGLGSIAVITGLVKLAGALWGVIEAIIAFGIATLTNPTTWIIAGIAALIAVIILCIKHWDELKQKATEVWESIKNTFRKAGEWLYEHFGKYVEGMFKSFRPVLPDLSDEIDYNVNVPKLASGSVLNGGNPFLAWVNDQPKGQTNIEAPLDTIVQAFKEVSGNNTNQNIVIEANGDLGNIIREFNFRLKNENIRVGKDLMVSGDMI
ncbi:MAG: hypothetical protein IJP99_05815 [Methanobrevibacter sp.]|nr:hypothetical protein [Methanobrevibacter sp.]